MDLSKACKQDDICNHTHIYIHIYIYIIYIYLPVSMYSNTQVLEFERLELEHFWEIHRRQLVNRDDECLALFGWG